MFDVATIGQGAGDDADLALFVERLAAAGADDAATAAHARIRRDIAGRAAPPGLRRLAEALAAGLTELPPPRRPADDPGAVVPALRSTALAVLDGYDTDALAAAVAALLADGRRVLVTAATGAELAAVRAALPPSAAGMALGGLPAMSAGEVRELRTLQATATQGRRDRATQDLPPSADLLGVDEVARLCARVTQVPDPSAGAAMVPGLLVPLADDRRAAVTAVSRCVVRTLSDLPADRAHWTWPTLADLIYGRPRATFDRLQQDVSAALDALERIRGGPPVTFLGPLPADAIGALRRYQGFLADGGRARHYFRSGVQRDVVPVLAAVRVGTHAPESEPDVARVMVHLQIDECRARIDAGCTELGVPPPDSEEALRALATGIERVAAAARAVSSLRHDVLFLADDSPLAVPDVAAAHTVATAVLAYHEHGSVAEAGERLDGLAGRLAAHCPVPAMAPEHEAAVAALRVRDAAGYAAAVAGLAAARREARDERRRTTLLDRLADAAPQLAAAWEERAGSGGAAPGLAAFVRSSDVLSELPGADTCDVVVVLGAGRLGVGHLLLAAAAPRMVAVVAPDAAHSEAPTVASVLQRAGALVIRGGHGGAAGAPRPVAVPIRRPSPAPRSARTPVGQAGA